MRHEILVINCVDFVLRRTLADGRRKVWCGRDYGWEAWGGYVSGPQPKRYSQRVNARKALRRILAHERELGLGGCDYARRSEG